MMKQAKAKKAILFTIITLFLLTSVFVLTTAYVKRNRLYQEFISEAAIASRSRFIQEDIIGDYLTLLGITLDEISRNSTSVTLKFSNFSTVTSSINYTARLQNYKEFLEGTYANLSNTKIQLNNFVPVFHFYPYNSSFKISGKKLFFYGAQYSKLNYIDLELQASRNETDPTISEPVISCEAGCVSLILKVLADNGSILKSETYSLDPINENLPIKFRYAELPEPNFTVSFGKHTEKSVVGPDAITEGTLYIEANNLDVRINKFHLDYDLTDKNTILQTNATIYIE